MCIKSLFTFYNKIFTPLLHICTFVFSFTLVKNNLHQIYTYYTQNYPSPIHFFITFHIYILNFIIFLRILQHYTLQTHIKSLFSFYNKIFTLLLQGGIFMKETHKQYYVQLGLNIAYYRKLRGLTQMQLAEKTDISRTHISNIEAPNMNTSISLEKLFDIAEILEVSITKLFEFRE